MSMATIGLLLLASCVPAAYLKVPLRKRARKDLLGSIGFLVVSFYHLVALPLSILLLVVYVLRLL